MVGLSNMARWWHEETTVSGESVELVVGALFLVVGVVFFVLARCKLRRAEKRWHEHPVSQPVQSDAERALSQRQW